MILYRMTKTRYLTSAWSGLGAKEAGGRWNDIGVAMVYCSETASLTMLETLVHLNAPQLMDSYSLLAIEIPDEQIQAFDRSLLPHNWDREEAPAVLAHYGDGWIDSRASIALAVPSALSPVEANYLINPNHPGFYSCLEKTKVIPFRFDSRLKRA